VVIRTNLLHKLEHWTSALGRHEPGTPRILLLVGGPGNGKTEAIESTIHWLDHALGRDRKLADEFRRAFSPEDGLVPRVVTIQLRSMEGPGGALSVVQDASVVTQSGGRSAAELLVEELADAIHSEAVYLCCANRGVLDDALIRAIDSRAESARALLEAVTRAVSLFPDAPSCWPLEGFPEVAVWPMDVESLLLPTEGEEPPARKLLASALVEKAWAPAGTCAAGAWCPFCSSREHLARPTEQEALLRILRWYEVASGRRWSFRDLFSLVSYLLAGSQTGSQAGFDPCQWAARQVAYDAEAKRGGRPTKETSSALFLLAAAQYPHALFHRWDREAGPSLLRDLRELDLGDDNTAMGLQWFLMSRRRQYLPAMISQSLEGISDILDPAAASSDTEVQPTQRTRFALREVDVRFSRSVHEGLAYLRRLQFLPRVEVELLERLAKLDAELSRSAIRRKRPATAGRVQRMLRDFSCRLVRRTLGARTAVVADGELLDEFQLISEDAAGDSLYEVAREVERLLNTNQDFEVSLTTTFGQPLPPPSRRATLVAPSRSVRPLPGNDSGRPGNPVAYLSVGGGRSKQPIALTYELFKAVKELERGMSPASLPRSVLALLDTTRARLGGAIVRDRDVLDRARIILGDSGVAVEERSRGFRPVKEGRVR